MDANETVIKRETGFIPINFRELWEFHELLYFLTWKDIKVKYKQSVLGIGWIIFRPVISMIILTVIFGKIAKFPSEGIPYSIFVFLGLVPWIYFSTSFAKSTESLTGSAHLISKIYFPRILLPVSVILANLIDLIVSFSFLILLMFYHKIIPHPGILLLPLVIIGISSLTLGLGLFLGALNVKYRDIGQIIPFMIQIWMYITPIVYPVNFIPERYRFLIYLNPMSGYIETSRTLVLGHVSPNLGGLILSILITIFFLVFGLYHFKRVERSFVDVI